MNRKILGFVFILVSISLMILNIRVTGAVIGAPLITNFIAIVFFVVGLVFVLQRGKNYAQKILDQRRYVDDTRELKSIARKMGYDLVEGYKEGTRVCNGTEVLTVIPHHRRIQGRGTVKSILEALATGESNFRKRQEYHH